MTTPELKPCPFCGAGTTEVRENGRPWLGTRYGDPSSVSVRHWCDPIEGQPSPRMIERVGRDRAAAIAAWNRRAQSAEIERLRAEVAEWKRVAAAQAGLHDEAEARAKRLEKRLSAYQAAVNKIDDLIEYSLPMPSGTKAALYAVLANLTATIAVELTSD